MLSYLHGFHAGNSADVLKHSALIFCLEYLKKKENPVLCVDTHAGAGFYDLTEKSTHRNKEWEQGLGQLLQTIKWSDKGAEGITGIPPMIASYVKLICIEKNIPARYFGSPVIMAKILGKGDRLVCFELHPREAETLKASMAEIHGDVKPTIEVRREDGPEGLKALLPPPSRRGLILIDPSWEEKDEYENIPRAVESGLKHFPEGTFIIWYPLLALPKSKDSVSAPIQDVLFNLSKVKHCRLELNIRLPEFMVGPIEKSPRNMYGSGLVIYNPPWTLRSALEETMPYLAKVLGEKGASWRLDWKDV